MVFIFKKIVSLFLTISLLCTGFVINVQALDGPNSIGFAERGIEAHRDGWQYVYGGKGQYQDGVRVSDCAGLLYSYFSDMGISGCYGGCTGQVTNNCILSCKLNDRIPRIHGLAVTMYDTVDPAGGIYGHIGIYIGGEEVCDNSTYGTNMVRANVFTRDWTEWHLFDLGMRYPVNGWYEFDGGYVHYTDYEYDVNTVVDGISIGSDGKASDHGILSNEWATASQVRDYLVSHGWQNNGGVDFEANATVTGNSVRVRSSASLSGSVVSIVNSGIRVHVSEEVTGEAVSGNNKWYKIQLSNGLSGYMSSLYVRQDDENIVIPGSVSFVVQDGYVSMSCDSDDIYYTIDGSDPVEHGSLYVGQSDVLGCTYRAVGCTDGKYGPVSSFTVCSNGYVFDDFDFGDWFAGYVDDVVTKGLFVGTGNNKFSPNMKLTRGQFVVALARQQQIDLSEYAGYSDFDDVGINAYYVAAVNWAHSNNIVSGVGNNKFSPNAVITREQMCLILSRCFGLNVEESYVEFDDDYEISGWAKDAVYACRLNGLVSGVGNNKFNPKGYSTRAQAATIMSRLT